MLWNSKWFPGTNLQDINLDWILKKISALRGGAAGQVLSKKTGTDFDFEWVSGGGGTPGATFIPSVSSAGVISWTNDGGLPNPDPVNIKGPRGNTGNTGATGPAGPGLTSGGEIGQIPVKSSDTDYATSWKYPLDGIVSISTADEDLDTYTTGGYWYFPSAYTPLNKPENSGAFGFLLVFKSTSNSRIAQVWFDTSINAVYIRKNSTSTISWSDWVKLSEDTSFQPVSASATLIDPLPTGVSSALVNYVKTGNVVQVYYAITRTSDAVDTWTTLATGLPIPEQTYSYSNVAISYFTALVSGVQSGRPLQGYVGKATNVAGYLRFRYGQTAGTYVGTFTYITSDI